MLDNGSTKIEQQQTTIWTKDANGIIVAPPPTLLVPPPPPMQAPAPIKQETVAMAVPAPPTAATLSTLPIAALRTGM